jgi:hypothetical protein
MTNANDPQSGWVWLTISGMGPGATRGAWVGRIMALADRNSASGQRSRRRRYKSGFSQFAQVNMALLTTEGE